MARVGLCRREWCYEFYSQSVGVTARMVEPEWDAMVACEAGCHGRGRCDHVSGTCR